MFANAKLTQAVAYLTETIQSEVCFQTYNNARNLIESNAPVKELLAVYRRFHNEIENKRRKGAEISFDEEKQVSHIYWELMRDDTAKAYLESEKELIALVRTITMTVFDAAKIDMDYL